LHHIYGFVDSLRPRNFNGSRIHVVTVTSFTLQ